ncbi:GAF domain-containing sensor histidine kinase [Mucilaginibacter achroorhodeus]|uniref:histidine kinase n=1 Tax=Mucilaginibacter achroorhodeus TaxID=2599294 RepID=A0A563U704_9SPHI|nr:GAF domain-containing sensor histidine kinase [Mucilaginibacter achroorhodeus]TWR27125.1 GAF domain-containing sensor histidine kinase [Mucilaginibacter achroorhodeus]
MNDTFPVPENEDGRLKSLFAYDMMDTEADTAFDELTALASEIAQTPIALVTLLDGSRQWFKSAHGTELKQSPREHAFCSHTIMDQSQPMIVQDARRDDRFKNNPLVTGDTQVVFYAGIPLVNEDGFALGSLCVIDHEPKQLSDSQIKALGTLAKQVLTQMELRRKIAQLEDINKALTEANIFIQKFAHMAAHDIKNPMSSIMLTAQALEARLKAVGDEKSMGLAVMVYKAAKRLINLLNEMLDYSKEPSALVLKQQDVCLPTLLKSIVDHSDLPNNVNISLPQHECIVRTSAVALEQIFMNLLNNAVRYNDKEAGDIKISYTDEGEHHSFTIKDNGIGIAAKNIDRIFDRSVTLNKVDRFNKPGKGLGLYTVKSLVNKLEGDIRVESTLGEGSVFTFTIKKQLA